jgi:hypothetical protein
VKQLVGLAQNCGLQKETIGFSNGRMAYDDVLARVCMFNEAKTFHARVTAAALTDKYRSSQPFPDEVITAVERAVRLFALGRASYGKPIRLNKATLLSWLLFSTENQAIGGNGHLLSEFIRYFEQGRERTSTSEAGEALLMRQWLLLYEDRASSRVNDTLSIAARDFVLWLTFVAADLNTEAIVRKIVAARESLLVLRSSAAQNRYLEPAGFVQSLLDRRLWDLVL